MGIILWKGFVKKIYVFGSLSTMQDWVRGLRSIQTPGYLLFIENLAGPIRNKIQVILKMYS